MAGRPRKNSAQSVQGVGESRIFGGAEPEYPEGKSAHCTVNGEPLPEEFWHSFPYSLTDEGKKEAALLKKELPVSYANHGEGEPFDYSNVRDDDQKLNKFRDDLKLDTPRPQRNAMDQLMQKHLPKGQRGLWMGKIKSEREGLVRDELEYKPVLVKNEETGAMERVNLGGMFLGSVPEPLAREQERLNITRAKEREVAAADKVLEQSDRILSEPEMRRIARNRRTLSDLEGSVLDNPETADRELLEHVSD